VRTLSPVLLHEADERSATDAATLRTAFSEASPETLDMTAVLTALDALYPCG